LYFVLPAPDVTVGHIRILPMNLIQYVECGLRGEETKVLEGYDMCHTYAWLAKPSHTVSYKYSFNINMIRYEKAAVVVLLAKE
jgi:hypothetical protein